MQPSLDLWRLETAYTVGCVHCYICGDAIKPSREEAIAAFLLVGWQITEIGPWCPDCAPLLTTRRGRKRNLQPGDRVCEEVRHNPLGTIIRVGDGYAEVRMADGYPSVFALCELIKE